MEFRAQIWASGVWTTWSVNSSVNTTFNSVHLNYGVKTKKVDYTPSGEDSKWIRQIIQSTSKILGGVNSQHASVLKSKEKLQGNGSNYECKFQCFNLPLLKHLSQMHGIPAIENLPRSRSLMESPEQGVGNWLCSGWGPESIYSVMSLKSTIDSSWCAIVQGDRFSKKVSMSDSCVPKLFSTHRGQPCKVMRMPRLLLPLAACILVCGRSFSLAGRL